MKSHLVVFLLTFCLSVGQKIAAQAIAKNDSLEIELHKIKDPNQKVDQIIAFLDKPENQYLDNADVYANRALTISQQTNYSIGKINSMIKLGFFYYRRSEYKKAMEFAQRSEELAEDMNFNKELANSLGLIGSIYSELGDYDRSSQYLFRCLKIFEKLNDSDGISRTNADIGNNFCSQQEYKKALEYFNKSLALASEIRSLPSIKRAYNNLAVVYGDLLQYDTANLYLTKALVISRKLGDKFGQGINIMNIGYGQMNTGKFDEALVSFQQSLDLFTELNNRLHMAECYTNFGFCYYTAGEIDKSISYFKIALFEGQAGHYYRIINSTSGILNTIYIRKKDSTEAYRYLLLEKASGDSLFAAQKQKQSEKLELQYIFEKKEFDRKLAQQAKSNFMLVIIFSLISGFAILVLLFSRYRLKSKFVLLEKEKLESELDIKDRELTVNLISLIKKNEMLSGLSNTLVQLENKSAGLESKEVITRISQELRSSTDDKMLHEFSTRFQEVHAGFYEKLLNNFPDLTQNELKICAYLRLNMSTKDISELTGQQLSSIDQARYRLRKKLGITNSETNLVTFLSQV